MPTLDELLLAALSTDQPGLPMDTPFSPTQGQQPILGLGAPPPPFLQFPMPPESPLEFPTAPLPNPGFGARLGIGLQGMAPASGNTGADAILGLLQGFGAAGLGAHQAGVQQTTNRNAQITEAARMMGQRRAETKREALEKARLLAAQATADKNLKAAEVREDKRYERGLATQEAIGRRQQIGLDAAAERQQNGIDASMDRLITGIDARQAGSTDEDVEAWTQRVVNGEAQITSINDRKLRTAVNTNIERKGLRIIPDKARKAIDELAAAVAVLDEIEGYAGDVFGPADKPGLGRFARGASKKIGAITQINKSAARIESLKKQMAGNLARAVGAERGVLTQLDVDRTMQGLPSLNDSQDIAVSKLTDAREFLKTRAAQSLKNYTTASPGTSNPRAKVGSGSTDQADFEFVPGKGLVPVRR